MSNLLAEALFLGSFLLAAYAVLVLTVFPLFVVLYEEPTLARLFGDDHRRYRCEVPRWLAFARIASRRC